MSEEKTSNIPIEEAEETADPVGEVEAENAEEVKEEAGESAEEAAEETKEETSGEEEAGNTEPAEETEAPVADNVKQGAESERYMRLMAEFQNYKKRVAKEKTDIHAYANEKIMTGLLEVLDNFERALASDPAADPEAYAKGMDLIFTQMKGVLSDAGLEEIESLGEDFDPNKHNAVMTEDSDEYESGKVSRVFQKGYTLNKKVIRPSMVVVVK